MSFSEVVLFVGLGAVVGFAGGLFAIGGALIAIPLLTAGFGFTQHDSQGTAMLMLVPASAISLVVYSSDTCGGKTRSRRSGRGRYWP
jgi:uncharacterized membrane protein YfcA